MFKQILCASLLTLAAGCQLSTASLTKHFGGNDEPTPTETAQPAPAKPAPMQEPAYHSEFEGGPAEEAERAPEVARSEPPPQRVRVDLRAGERAPAGAETTCRVQGRSAMCGGVCTDVQADNNHCGQCNDSCDSGSRCDYGTCRDAAGNPT